MTTIKKELIYLRTFTICIVSSILLLFIFAFKSPGNKKFETIDVERINIVEKDGTIKMVITNVAHFPTSGDTINNRPFHERKKRSGMLFFNEDGMECGGFIFDGAKTENGHSAGLSLTFDQYDGDQVMQLLTTDEAVGDNRYKKGGLMFNDRGDKETQLGTLKIMKELEGISDSEEKRKKFQEYLDNGELGGVPRVYLGQSGDKNNGLFLFDNEGKPKAMFYIDDNNEVKLEVLNEKGEVISSWPE